jgi:uncharacterized protein DUF1707/cell wall-active antibiotic response 4TMS protein YvqF
LNDPNQLVSDADREQTVSSLRDDLLAGRLTLEEFSERVELAYRARIGQELVRAREDLPVATVPSRRRPARLTAAVFGHVIRRGRFRLRQSTAVVNAFADVDLDLREAEIEGPETTVTMVVAFGNVDVYVPEGIDVDLTGITIFGRRRDWGRDTARADAPTVHIRTLGVFATVDVWRVPPQLRGGYREITRALQAEQPQLPSP